MIESIKKILRLSLKSENFFLGGSDIYFIECKEGNCSELIPYTEKFCPKHFE